MQLNSKFAKTGDNTRLEIPISESNAQPQTQVKGALKLKRKEKQDQKLEDKIQDIFKPTAALSHKNLTERKEVCEDCKKTEFVHNRAEGTVVCTSCGLVQQASIIDEGCEWRNFSNDNGGGTGADMNRVGGKLNPYLSDFGLNTVVKGNGAKEIAIWSERTAMSAADKSITKGMKRIKEVASCLSLKEATISKACDLYKKIADSGELKGKSIDSRVATCIFMASRIVGQPKPIKKILTFSDVTEKDLSKTYKRVKLLFPEYQTRLQASKVAEQACITLNLPSDIIQACKVTCDNISNLQMIEGKKPQTIAGTAIYTICQLSTVKKSIEEIAQVVNIKPSTIQETFRLTASVRQHLLPEFWLSKETNQ